MTSSTDNEGDQDREKSAALSFGYAAVCLTASLTITQIGDKTELLEWALLCFSIGMPTALLAGLLYQFSKASPKRTLTQNWLLYTADWGSLVATALGLFFLIRFKFVSSGWAFCAGSVISIIALFLFVAETLKTRKKMEKEEQERKEKGKAAGASSDITSKQQ